MKVLITGSAGFVGRHLRAACEARGDQVTALDIEDGRNAMSFFWGQRLWPEECHFDLVLHCAAFVKGRSGIDGLPAHLHAYNTALDASMFYFAIETRPGRVVYFSSSAAYPLTHQLADLELPLREEFINVTEPGAPEASYGRVKLHGEQMAADARAAGVPVTVLRPFSGYGADQSLDYPFPSFIARAKARQDPFEIWGDGTQVRDWIHIDDIVAATLKAVDEGVDGPVNLCTGEPTNFLELATMVTDVAGYKPKLRTLDDKPAGVDYRVGDPTRLHEFYKPKIGIVEGILRALCA